MINLSGYQILEKVHIGSRTVVYRALRLKDNYPVILKILKHEYPSLEDVATIEHEYHILKKLHIPGVIETHELIKYQNRLVLILDEGKGETLEKLIQKGPIDMAKFFKIAVPLVTIVGELHRHHVIHKDIKPTNIIIDPKDDSISLIDFSIASELLDRISPNANIYHLEGTLSYMSPEQTGRMNISLDQRTDLYSIGVVLYELLTGQRPFINDDSLELIYSHLARQPIALNILTPTIPEQISNIILKLLAKDPSERYFSAEGLKADINECLMQWHLNKHITPFALGRYDEETELRINQKLYGRKKEINELLTVFHKISNGEIKSACFFVSGYAGIGKSALAQVLQKPIISQNGYFISGKFEQLQKNIPYSGIIKAFQMLIGQIMSQSKESILPIKNKIITALGNLGQVIIDIIPELQWLIGAQTPVPKLTPAENQNRFMLVFQRFLESIILPGHPLVLFLDDLQWADSASLKLMEYILTDKMIDNLLIITAYRNNEIGEHHPVTFFIKKIQESGVNVHYMALAPLTLENVNELIQDNLYTDYEESLPLSKLLVEKTAGNAFFIKKYLQELKQEKQITYNREQMKWTWNINTISQLDIADNVVDLMIRKIDELDKKTKRTIALAACIGNKFKFNTLAKVSNRQVNELAIHLKETILAGHILPLDDAYKYVELLSNPSTLLDSNTDNIYTTSKDIEFQFLHDRVQQAAYTFIPEDKKQETHLKIGRLLLKFYSNLEESDKLFEILNHLNKGIDFIKDSEETEFIADLNLQGGQRAKAATAHETAIDYFQAGINLLGDRGWSKSYDLTFLLYKEASQCKYFCGHFMEAEQDFVLLLNKAHSNFDKASILDMRAELYSNLGKYQDAVNTQLQALDLLGINFPKKVTSLHILLEMAKIRFLLSRKKISDLDKQLNRLSNPSDILITAIFNHLIFPTYSSDESVFALTICKSVTFFLRRGYSMYSLENLLNYAIILDAQFKKFDQGLDFTMLVKKLEATFDNRQIYARNSVTIAVFINHWHYHLKKILPSMQESIMICKEVGDLFYAAGTSAVYTIYLFEAGIPLKQLLTEIDSSLSFLKREGADFEEFSLILNKMIKYLCGVEISLEKIFSDLEKMKKTENNSTYFVAHYYASQLLYYIGDYDRALKYLTQANLYKQAAIGTFPMISSEVFQALILGKLYEKASRTDRYSYIKTIRKSCKNLLQLSKQCPENFSHMANLVCGELSRIKGRVDKAAQYYDKAIQDAQANGYLQYAAIANECAAQLYEPLNREVISRAYLQGTHYSYLRWGAKRKSAAIEERFPHLQEVAETTKDTWSSHLTTSPSSVTITNESILALDLFSILKANRALASEVTLPNVLQKLLEIVLESSGAQRAMLISVHDNRLFIEAEGQLVENTINVKLISTLAELRSDLPHSLLNYVLNTQEQVICDNISIVGQFNTDPYIQYSNLKSVLCIPIIHKNLVSNILYLENNLLSGAFTKEHAKLINALAAQAAISLENAKLYSAYEKFVPYQFLQQLSKSSITDVRLGDQVELTMTILFCDIQGFSQMSENMLPSEIFDFINQFLSIMEPVIRKHRGFIDKYIGDAIMALFSEGYLALKAALEISDKLEEFNRLRARSNSPQVNVGIGIDTGKVMLGIVGSHDRIETSVLSDAVNNASNIQHLTRSYKAPILLTAETKAALYNPENFSLRLIGKVRFKGKQQPIELWELLREKE